MYCNYRILRTSSSVLPMHLIPVHALKQTLPSGILAATENDRTLPTEVIHCRPGSRSFAVIRTSSSRSGLKSAKGPKARICLGSFAATTFAITVSACIRDSDSTATYLDRFGNLGVEFHWLSPFLVGNGRHCGKRNRLSQFGRKPDGDAYPLLLLSRLHLERLCCHLLWTGKMRLKDYSHVGRNQSIKPHHAAFPARCGQKLAAAATVTARETSRR
ncbi:hypothetical protein BKA56DRAFT_622981 [Ilyonectria sp. MPI-CAGE-AT-0026]|nr:hypothetical protein BKA56DRAFT_622981 [Ilyonectria sp. MPI-CAGE-AT-0026]